MKELTPGLWPVMLTPFKENLALDLDGLIPLTEFYLEAGVNGLFANCLSSEMFQLTATERHSLTQAVVKAAKGRVQVISTGTFGGPVSRQADYIRAMADTGVAAVVINTNQLVNASASEASFKHQIEALLAQTDPIPLGLYECPVPYKRLLSPALCAWLGQTGRFVYLKDTCCDANMIGAKIAALEGTALGVYNAHTPTSLASLHAGAQGLSPIGANLYPELFVRLMKLATKPKPELEKLHSLLCVMDSFIHQNYPYSAKHFLQLRGLPITTACRIPHQPFTANDRTMQDALLRLL